MSHLQKCVSSSGSGQATHSFISSTIRAPRSASRHTQPLCPPPPPPHAGPMRLRVKEPTCSLPARLTTGAPMDGCVGDGPLSYSQGCVRTADDRRREGGGVPPAGPPPPSPAPRFHCGTTGNLQKEILIWTIFGTQLFGFQDPPPLLFYYMRTALRRHPFTGRRSGRATGAQAAQPAICTSRRPRQTDPCGTRGP